MSWIRLIGLIIASAIVGGVIGYSLGTAPMNLPQDFSEQLGRFSFVDTSTNQTLGTHKVLGRTEVKGEGGVLESYIVGFEDRYGLPDADNDFLDLMVEMKRVRGGGLLTVRVVQLGRDAIDVYLDDEFLGRARASIEVQIETQA
ncbi:MAG: hypothetical protein ACE5GD_06375 [Candidatus Geothermarchaeales archaeon]